MQVLRPARIALVVALGLAFQGSASAETSSVTLYGRVVAGLDYITKADSRADGSEAGKSVWRGASNQWNPSLLGFRGEEQLDGDLKTVFLLENGFQATKGTGNADGLFNRRAYVGFDSRQWGRLTIGKNLSISNDVYYIDPTGQQFIGTATLVRGRNWQIPNNIVEYQSPTLAGFQVGVQTSLGEQTSYPAQHRDAVSAVYRAGSAELRAIWDTSRDADGRYSDLFLTSRELTLGGAVTLGDVKLLAGWQDLAAPDAAPGAPTRGRHGWIGTNWQATRRVTVIGAAYRVVLDRDNGHANLFALGANYAFSPRTLAYFTVGTVRNSDRANFSVETTDNRPGFGASQLGSYAGFAHSF
ncbi:porin [Derxia gummosa]|uniref:Porin n=1 Tax=Derxia gummosa DSM 723 TaxID=1121388 RepID=A0A8B6X4C5_9BURK|nr:porin [Derxia gummosa]